MACVVLDAGLRRPREKKAKESAEAHGDHSKLWEGDR
jgi:hypothetical protein